MPKGFQSKEEARAAGLKGAAAMQAKARRRREDPLFTIKDALPGLFALLLQAARGEGLFKDLPSEKQLAAITKAIEYGIGKPIGLDKTPVANNKEEGGGAEPVSGISIE